MTGLFNSVVSGPDGVEIEILDTIQAPKWKGDGQILVTVYSGRYREEEVILKVILMAYVWPMLLCRSLLTFV